MAALKILTEESLTPSIILTNDWSAGFAAAYRHMGLFGDYFKVGLLEY